MSDDEYMKALEVQRRNFEAQFGSIEEMGFKDKSKQEGGSSDEPDEQDEQDELESEDEDMQFKGFDDESSSSDSELESEEEEEEAPKPKVIKLTDTYHQPIISKKDQKKLRSGRAPTLAELEQKRLEKEKISAKQARMNKKEDDENLENDIKLQRLLQESHILSKQVEYSGADVTLQTLDYEEPTGKARKKALTSRIRELSSVNSSTNGLPKKLEKMPMSMRKGMIQSREKKIAKYEQEAKDAGIILSKVKKGELRDLDIGRGSTFASDRLGTGKKQVQRVRDRGLKINSVGKSTRNGLVISAEEISRINGKRRR